MVVELPKKWAEEYPPEKLETLKSYFSVEIISAHDIRTNTLNSACKNGIFPCAKFGNNWKIYDTEPFRAWLVGHKNRAGRGQGRKPKSKENQE